MILTLATVSDPSAFGGKAVQLGAAIRAGLPVPAGFAISSDHVEGIARGDPAAVAELTSVLTANGSSSADGLHAVRSSAIGEDSDRASFAGAHHTVLGASGIAAIVQAVHEVHTSGRERGAQAYRARLGLDQPSAMAVVVQQLVDADVAGVLFTRNPVTGAAERLIEASWGLGEAVVSGLVTPDSYRLDLTGRLLTRRVGAKDLTIRPDPTGGTKQIPVPPAQANAPCLTDRQLAALNALATACDRVYDSPHHDIEFAFRGEVLYLLQRRPITSS